MGLLTSLLGETTYKTYKDRPDEVVRTPGSIENAYNTLKNKIKGVLGFDKEETTQASPQPPLLSATPAPQMPTPAQVLSSPTPVPQAPQAGDIEKRIRERLISYGGEDLPALQYLPEFVEATQNYDLFKHNPYLLPQISILETSGGRNVTRPNNLINYGVRSPEIMALFERVGMQEALKRSIKEMGETGSAYARFRTGRPLTDEELMDFARTYEPMNESYYENLRSGMSTF